MIDRVEILTGSASAVYGSDAMAGVINFILKKSTDGITIDYRYGDTERGGGASHNLSLTGGFERGDFSGIVGLELIGRIRCGGTDREIQDSTLDFHRPRAAGMPHDRAEQPHRRPTAARRWRLPTKAPPC